MESLLKALLVGLAGLIAAAAPVAAHPHVYVSTASQILYAPDGAIAGVRHAWTFDEMFSVLAVQGYDQKEKGKFTREELAPLAEINVTALKEYDYFTYAKADGKPPEFKDASDYYFSFENSALTLHFTVTLKKPVKAKAFEMEVYDPSYMVDFKFADKDPVKLVNAPAACKSSIAGPAEMSLADGKRLSEQTFQDSAAQNWGSQFASKLTVRCQ